MVAVSVVIPTYNRSGYLREAIISVINQTYQDYEIIVVDDGSTDDTSSMIMSLKLDKLRYIYQDNSGSAVARNRAMLNSYGKYIAFLDSDDLWVENKLEKQVKIMEAHDDVGLVYCDCRIGVDVDSGSNGYFSKYNPPSGDIFARLVHSNYIWTPSVMIRRSILPETGIFDPILLRSQDYDFWLRIAHCTKCYYISEPLVHVREHAGRITKDNSKYLYVCYVRELQVARWAHMPGMRAAFSEQVIKYYLNGADKFRTAKDYINVLYCYDKALVHSNVSIIKLKIYIKKLIAFFLNLIKTFKACIHNMTKD